MRLHLSVGRIMRHQSRPACALQRTVIRCRPRHQMRLSVVACQLSDGRKVPSKRWLATSTAAMGDEKPVNSSNPDSLQADYEATSNENGEHTERLLTIPNVITVARMCVTPLIGEQLYLGHHETALMCLFLAGFSDYLDGYIARSFPSQASVIGGVIDPIADKLLISVVTVGMASSGLIPGWLAALILGRDAVLMGGSLYIRYVSLQAHFETVTSKEYWNFRYPSVIVRPTKLSKGNTAIQIATLFFSLGLPVAEISAPTALFALWMFCAVTTVGSFSGYVLENESLEFLKPPTNEWIQRWPSWARSRMSKE